VSVLPAGEHIVRCAPFIKECWGVDNNPSFIQHAKREAANAGVDNVKLIQHVSDRSK